ncbi:unnamed protein product [Urochloa decumbens]|uniref:Glycosyltransferase n=1 Tax=Urochloa decumbens TaxID=240449 RepID=A0ABC9FIC7_9POAL
MGSTPEMDGKPPHVVLVPFPAHGHVAPHVQLGRVLRARGVHVTLVHTELHHRRLLLARSSSGAGDAAAARDDGGLAVEVIPDGLSIDDPPRSLRALHEALESNCLEPFTALLRDMLLRSPPASCVVADTPMPFAAAAARAAGVPDVQFFTASAAGLMGYLQFHELLARGVVPIKQPPGGSSALDAPLEWVPGMKGMRLRDMPTFCHTSDAGDWLLHFHVHQMRVAAGAAAVVLNTFVDMERDVVHALKPLLPPVYTVGPLTAVLPSPAATGGGDGVSLMQEDGECMAWLDGKAARSVVYVSFGSHASMGGARLREIAAGLARCGSPYLWVLRPEMAAEVAGVGGDGDGLVVPWCDQEAVLRHPAVGLFVTHCGWNSILESVAAGVPVLGCPVLSEQTTNCRQACTAWGVGGGELPEGEAGGEEVAAMVREMMGGRKGEEAREKTMELKRLAEESAKEGGSSYENVGRLVEDVLLKVKGTV